MLALVTAPPDHAEAIAREVVTARLAACANIVPGLKSVYWWQGEVQEDEEALLLLKTATDLVEPLKATLERVHPYENFELIVAPITGGSAAYIDWILASTSPADAG
jgi:periplasmic divalent cation tolerance protein